MMSSSRELAIDPLTDRESEVLQLMAAGHPTRQIAEEMHVTVETVRWYAKQIYSKLGVHSRSQAALQARDLGLLETGGPIHEHTQTPGTLHNLPQYLTPFIGRKAEFKELVILLQDPLVRLITVTGPAGMGKTRLCVQAGQARAARFADGVYFVSLTPLDKAEMGWTKMTVRRGEIYILPPVTSPRNAETPSKKRLRNAVLLPS